MSEFILPKSAALLADVQAIACEWQPDEEGVLGLAEQQKLADSIKAKPIEQPHFVNVLSYLVSFCWEWVPDEDFDEEEVNEQMNILREAETHLETLKK